MPETERRRRPHPPPPTHEPTRQPTSEEPTRQPRREDTTNNEELIFVSTVEVNEIMGVATESEKLTTEESTSEGVTDQTVEVNEITNVATESEKLTTEESTSEGVTDQIREMATELDGGVTVEPIVILPESDESDTDYEEFIPGEIPDYSGSDNYDDFLPDENKR